MYEVQSEGLDGDVKFFRKPWAMTTIMFMGMSLCLPLAFMEERQKTAAAAAAASEEPLLSGNGTTVRTGCLRNTVLAQPLLTRAVMHSAN